jgi:hypothetical protein
MCHAAGTSYHSEDEHFHKYLYGEEFHLRTDHSALTWFLSFKNLEGQTARWIQSLQESNFIPDHRQGRKHNNAVHFPDDPAKKNVPTATMSRNGQKSNMYEVLQPLPQPALIR